MAEEANDKDALLLLLAVLAVANSDDPEIIDYLLHSPIRDRLRRSSAWTPDLDELLFRYPRVGRRAFERRLEQAREVAAVEARKFLGTFDATQTERLGEVSARLQRLEEASTAPDRVLREARAMLDEMRSIADRIVRERKSLSDDVARLSARVGALDEDLSTQRMELLRTEDSVHSLTWLLSTGANIAEAEATRHVPVRVYLPDPVPKPAVLKRIVSAIDDLNRTLGLEKSVDLPEESGSWWKRWFARAEKAITQDEVLDRLKKAEQALELKYLDKPQAEANKEQAQAAACLITALDKVPTACIQVGSLLMVKAPDASGAPSVVIRTLTTSELKRLEQHQSMLQKPNEILGWLAHPPLPASGAGYDPRAWERDALGSAPPSNEQLTRGEGPLLLASGPSTTGDDPDPQKDK